MVLVIDGPIQPPPSCLSVCVARSAQIPPGTANSCCPPCMFHSCFLSSLPAHGDPLILQCRLHMCSACLCFQPLPPRPARPPPLCLHRTPLHTSVHIPLPGSGFIPLSACTLQALWRKSASSGVWLLVAVLRGHCMPGCNDLDSRLLPAPVRRCIRRRPAARLACRRTPRRWRGPAVQAAGLGRVVAPKGLHAFILGQAQPAHIQRHPLPMHPIT